MAFEVFALPGDVPIERWDSASVTEGSGLGVADAATLTGSDPGWYAALSAHYDALYFVEGEITYGPYDIVSVSERGEAGVWTANLVENYYWESRVATLPSAVEGVIQLIFAIALRSAYASVEPFAGWPEDLQELIISFMSSELDGATEWDALVSAAEKWGLTAYTERTPGFRPIVRVIPRYPTDGGPTGRRVEVPWEVWDVSSRQRQIMDRANPLGGWRTRRIVSSTRSFLDLEEIETLSVGSREPAHYLDIEEAGLAKISEELERWRQQNECESLNLTFPLAPMEHMGQVRSHDIVTIADVEGEWRVVAVEGRQDGTQRTARLRLMRWQGFFERIEAGDAPAPVTGGDTTGGRTERTLRGIALISVAGNMLRLVLVPDFGGGDPAEFLVGTVRYDGNAGLDTTFRAGRAGGYTVTFRPPLSGSARVVVTATAEGYQGEIRSEFDVFIPPEVAT